MSSPDASSSEARPEARGAVESALSEATTALPQVLRILGSVVAPTTLLTALLFLFGWMYAIAFFDYFGVPVTVLDLPIRDYLILSADGLIVPLIVVAGIALLVLWAHRLQVATLSPRARLTMRHALLPVTTISGLLLVSLTVASLVGKFTFPFLEGGGLSFVAGVLLLAYAARLLRLLVAERRKEHVPQPPSAALVVTEWCALFVLVSVGLFWAVGSYAIGAGTGHAQEIVQSMPRLPDVVVYSERSLSLHVPGVREVACENPEAAYRFRYEGLKLIPQSGNQHLFLPAGWTRESGTAIILPRTEALRLELSPASQARDSGC